MEHEHLLLTQLQFALTQLQFTGRHTPLAMEHEHL
jgi:hypothetical protein